MRTLNAARNSGDRRSRRPRRHHVFAAAGLGVIAMRTPTAAGQISDENQLVTLPETIVAQLGSARDQDKDRLKDDLEARLADVWRPFLEFDEQENNGENTDQPSLLPHEPRTLFLVHPVAGCNPDAISAANPCTLRVQYRPLFRMDGGYRGSDHILGAFGACTNHHSGDNLTIDYFVVSTDGVTWRLQSMDGWRTGFRLSPAGAFVGPNDVVQFGFRTRPRGSTEDVTVVQHTTRVAYQPPLPFWPTPDGEPSWPPVPAAAAVDPYLRPHPRIMPSAGKHHQYFDNGHCEEAFGEACDEDCGGGETRLVDLAPLAYFLNVGEQQDHPTFAGFINQPFVNELWHLGYPHELTWTALWHRESCGDIFTGGMNSGPNSTGGWQSGAGPDCTTPVNRMFTARP
jgi:hypothetical protein